jgi:Rab-GTPase-TBC domain
MPATSDLLDDNFELLLEETFSMPNSKRSSLKEAPDINQEDATLLRSNSRETPTASRRGITRLVSGPLEHKRFTVKLALQQFYEIYNPTRVDKIDEIVIKFEDDLLALYQQLVLKYELSFSASVKLFTSLLFDGKTQAIAGLFGVPVPIPSRQSLVAENLASVTSEEESAKKADFYRGMVQQLLQAKELDPHISLDVQRTHRELAFFHEKSTETQLAHILMLSTHLNGISYTQGMHEIAGIYLYTFKDEFLVFSLVNAILGDLREIYQKDFDFQPKGIVELIRSVLQKLKDLNSNLYKHMMNLKFPFESFLVRLLTTFLATELTVPDAVAVFDIVIYASFTSNNQKSHGETSSSEESTAIQTTPLRALSESLALAFFYLCSEKLLAATDLDQLMEIVSRFGRSAHFNVDHLISAALAFYAYENKIRGKRPHASTDILISKIGSVIQQAKGGLNDFFAEVINQSNSSR